MAQERSATGKADWGSFLPLAVRAFNGNNLDYLMKQAPEDVKAGSDLEFMLKRKNIDFAQHNQRLLTRWANRLTDMGNFRVFAQPPRGRGWRRVGDVRGGPQVHRVVRIERELVVDEEGREYPIKA